MSRLCRLPARLKLPDLITTMFIVDADAAADFDDRNDEDGLHVKVGKKSRPPLFVLEDELGPVITASFSISWNLEF